MSERINKAEVNIRAATLDDIKQLANLRILQQYADWGTSYFDYDNNFYNRTIAAISSFISNEQNGIILVAEIGVSIIATCGLQKINMLPQCNDNGKYGFIFNVFTQKEYRQNGIQSLLFEKIFEYAKNNKITELKLETDNDVAINLYKKYGFKFDTLTMIKAI